MRSGIFERSYGFERVMRSLFLMVQERNMRAPLLKKGPFSVSIRVRNIFPSKRESDLEIILAQSLLKGEKMDYLIQKATELGVKRIVPFISSRSIPLLEKTKRVERHRRWEKIAIGASKQCGRGVFPRIDPPGLSLNAGIRSKGFPTAYPLGGGRREAQRSIGKNGEGKRDFLYCWTRRRVKPRRG